jgi:hypothetical protein
MQHNSDFRDLFQCLNDAGARYLVVGAYAVIFHTEPRYTKDLDIWVEATPENAKRVWTALVEFGAPLHDLTLSDLHDPDMIYQVGIEPNRFDILMDVLGLSFVEAWQNRIETKYDDQTVFLLSREDLIRAKKAAGRPQDLLDATALESSHKKKS